MTYADRVAQEVARAKRNAVAAASGGPRYDDCYQFDQFILAADELAAVNNVLNAIAATGCKVVERTPTAAMYDAVMFVEAWDAAPPVPGDVE